jgi:predicted transcriptional regulator
MSQTSEQRQTLKETLKRLRGERETVVQTVTEHNKRHQAERKKIRGVLTEGPATVPALAAACEFASSEVLWHITAMRKYGELVESAQEGDYFTYQLVREKGGDA